MLFQDFRAIFTETIQKKLDREPVALLFSGGTDSLAIFWTLLKLQTKFRCYTFRLEQIESEDIVAARLACNTWQVPLEEIVIPYKDTESLANEIEELVKKFRTGRKTAIECIWPFMYIIPTIKEQQVWCGLNADDLWGSAKGIVINFSKDREGFYRKRIELMNNYYASAWGYLEQYCKEYNQTLVSPYRDQEVMNYLLSYSWYELNKPKQKIPSLIAFRKEFSKVSIWRLNDNLQCGSGIREYLARLLPHYHQTNMVSLYKKLLVQVELLEKQPKLLI